MQFPGLRDGINSIFPWQNHASSGFHRDREQMRALMRSAISADPLDAGLDDFFEGYYGLSVEDRRALLLTLATDYHNLDRMQVRALMKQYLEYELPSGDKTAETAHDEERLLQDFYRIEQQLRQFFQPKYEVLFERISNHPGGLRFLLILRVDILSFLSEEDTISLREVDSYLEEKLILWLSPASLEFHNITWDDPASLLEKIVAYKGPQPINNFLDLKRRLGVGRRCFGYFHPRIPGEPLAFVEVALMKNVPQRIQEILGDNPPIPESEATSAIFYSLSSTLPRKSAYNLAKFLLKRVIDVTRKDMPRISTFATLSPTQGFLPWLLPKLQASCERSASTFTESLLKSEEESALLETAEEFGTPKNGMEVMWKLLSSPNHEWAHSERLLLALRAPLMRLCARYLVQEKEKGKDLDPSWYLHVRNGAIIGRINWMADISEKGLKENAGIMVNYIYKLEHLEENAHSFFTRGEIHASDEVKAYLEA